MFPLAYRSIILVPQDLTEPRWVPVMARAGLNTLMLHAVCLPDDINALIWFRRSELGRRVYGECHARGIEVEYQMHTASWLLPRALYWEHPAMFRMDLQGNRVRDSNCCASSEAAWKIFDERTQILANELPSETGRYLLFADDVNEATCHCPECARYSASDQALIYANHLLASIRKVHPEARVSFLAYNSSLNPPDLVRPEEGIFLEFAPIRRCYLHALADPDCAVNRAQVAALERVRACFQGAPLHVTEYWLDAGRQSQYRKPFRRLCVSLEVMRADIAFYVGLGVTSIASYGCGCDDEYWQAFGEPPILEYGAALQGQ